MTPEQLDKTLEILKKHRVQQAQMPDLMVIFEADFAPTPGAAPMPGGWKSPERLDHPDQFAAEHEVP